MDPLSRGISLFVILVITGGILAVCSLPERAEGVGEMAVTAFLDQGMNRREAHVDPERGGIVTFTGYVVPLFPFEVDGQYARITLVAEAGGWETTEIPVLTATKITNELTFSVSIMVPPGTHATQGEVSHMITIGGSWTYEPDTRSGNVEPVVGMIIIKQYYLYKVTIDRPYVQVPPGTEVDISLLVENQGNGDDEIEIDIEGKEALENEGWTFQLNRTLYELPYRGKVEIGIRITTPKEWDAWVNEVRVFKFVIVSSQAVGTDEPEVYEVATQSMFVRVQGISVPGFEPLLTIVAVVTGAALLARRRLRR